VKDLYAIMKGKAYRLASTIIAPKYEGEDLLATIMSDSDHMRQFAFPRLLPTVIPAESHRQILLDGMAREYAKVESWIAYVDHECRDRGCDTQSASTLGGGRHCL
jgi:hypothetical protein